MPPYNPTPPTVPSARSPVGAGVAVDVGRGRLRRPRPLPPCRIAPTGMTVPSPGHLWGRLHHPHPVPAPCPNPPHGRPKGPNPTSQPLPPLRVRCFSPAVSYPPPRARWHLPLKLVFCLQFFLQGIIANICTFLLQLELTPDHMLIIPTLPKLVRK